MNRLKITLRLEIKSDPDDTDMLEQDIRDELAALAEEVGDLDYRVQVLDRDDDEEEDDEG